AINWYAVMLGTLTVAVYYLFPRITKAVPAVLVALLVGTLTAFFADLDVRTIGEIPAGLPALRLGEIFSVAPEHYATALKFGLTLALLGSIDSLLTSVIADNITSTQHNSRRELIGQGIGNSVAAIFGGIPGAGATKGTVVNIQAGGKTRLSGVFHGVILLIVLLGLGSFAAYIPLSVLAGLLIPVGLAIIDGRSLKHLTRVPKSDAAVLLIVLFMTVFGNLIYAVGFGVVLACVLFMKKAGDIADASSSLARLESNGEDSDAGSDRIYIKNINGPLFFGMTAAFQTKLETVSEDVPVLVFRMEDTPYIDQSGLYALEDAVLDLERKGADVLIVGAQDQPLDMMKRINLIPALIQEEHVFDTMADCQAWLDANYPTETRRERTVIA
ncbi:MAG: SulP family inorganic anion transporter, partial [Pseudomonadota bacterium]